MVALGARRCDNDGMDNIKLTVKREAFAQAYVALGNASEAYRSAYSTKGMKQTTVHVEASKLLAIPSVSQRVAQIKAEVAHRNAVTVDSLIAELEEARQVALREYQPAAMVAASMGKAKITGLDKLVLDHTSSDRSMSPTRTAEDMTDDELAAIIASRN